MRLFVALRPPAEVLAHLRGSPLLDGLRRGRPGQEHVTLAFLGEVEAAAPLAVRLQEHLGGPPAVRAPRLRLSGAGSFGRVVWLGPRGERDALRALHLAVTAALQDAGLPVDTRPWTPHLSVGRGSLPQALQAYDGPAASWQDVALVQSTPGPDGVRHAALRQWTLPSVGPAAQDVTP